MLFYPAAVGRIGQRLSLWYLVVGRCRRAMVLFLGVVFVTPLWRDNPFLSIGLAIRALHHPSLCGGANQET